MTSSMMKRRQPQRVLVVSKETHDLVTSQCVAEFIRNNPGMQGRKISQEIIIRRMADYYLHS